MTNKRVRHPKGGKSYKLSYNSSFQILVLQERLFPEYYYYFSVIKLN